MRVRKPKIDLVGYKNNHGEVVRADLPNKWAILCNYCGKEHIQVGRDIQRNQKSRACEKYKPSNYTGLSKRDVVIRNQYGITLDQYNAMLDEQDHKCAICGNEDEVEGRKLAIDHCHTTGKVRGLLCGKCNRGLGLFYDNQDLLNNAIQYLKNALAR